MMLDRTNPPRGGSGVPPLADYKRVILMLQTERDAALARAEAAEARVAELVTQRDFLLGHRETITVERDQAQERIAALEAAARATIAVAEYQSIDRELECLLCLVERGAHEATCPVGVLAALLEDG